VKTRVLLVSISLLILIACVVMAGDRRPITSQDLWDMKRVGGPEVSPCGKWAAVTATEYDSNTNKGQSDIWLVATDGSGIRRFTTGETSESSPAWSPCGKWIAFIAKREDERAQLHIIPVDGGEAVPFTDMPLGASNPEWMPDGKSIVFVSSVIPELAADLDSMRAELERRKECKVTAKVTEDRAYRYWDRWLTDGYIPHLYRIDVATKEFTDLTPNWDRYFSISGGISYEISPDGGEIAFTALRYGAPYDSLTSDIFLLDVSNPGAARNITLENPANDYSAYYTPDGKYLLYGRQKIIGFYGDQTELVRMDRRSGEKLVLTGDFDRSPGGWVTDEKGKTIYFTAEDRAMRSLYKMSIKGGEVKEVYRGGTNSALDILPKGRLVFLHQSLSQPSEVYSIKTNGKDLSKLTSFNDEIMASLEMGKIEDVYFEGAEGNDVQMFILYPPGFDVSKKWPLLMLVHGGPHGTFGDYWHYRWNAQAFAAPGYVTAMVNFHGSSSFGQDFTDAITGEVGRKPYVDVMNGIDYLVEKGFIDEERMAAAGGSYGGYLVSWIGTKTDRFACIINHAGVFDLLAQFGSDITFGRARNYGGQPWDGLEAVMRYSPAHHMADYVTPTLVIHGEKDYRVPVGNALEVYGILKAKGVPAKLIYFPDENHWVLTEKNSIFWYNEFHGWLDRWIGTGPE
jgi:dipeptidyl aminopeptidase/acylaminoacyl peptidase